MILSPQENHDRERCEVHFSGRVQGVGFRFTTKEISGRYVVDGFVRNLSNGNVQLVAEGTQGEIMRFLDDVRAAMAGKIHHHSMTWSSATGEFSAFDISY